MSTAEAPKTIDVTPTWADVLPYLLLAVRDANTEGQQIARKELARMAAAADLWNAHTAPADAVPELLAALQAIVDEAGPNFGRDDGLGSINRMSRIARLAIAKVAR